TLHAGVSAQRPLPAHPGRDPREPHHESEGGATRGRGDGGEDGWVSSSGDWSAFLTPFSNPLPPIPYTCEKCRLGLSVSQIDSPIEFGVILRLPEPPARIAMFAQPVLGGGGRGRISNFGDRGSPG